MSRASDDALIAELKAIPKAQRLAYLADLPEDRRAAFKRLLSKDDIAALNRHLTTRAAAKRQPTLDSWKDEARAGRATSPDAMIAVLTEIRDRLRPQDAQWVDRIERTAAGRSYSTKQTATIKAIYARYFQSTGVS